MAILMEVTTKARWSVKDLVALGSWTVSAELKSEHFLRTDLNVVNVQSNPAVSKEHSPDWFPFSFANCLKHPPAKRLSVDRPMTAYTVLFSALLSRLTVLTCGST